MRHFAFALALVGGLGCDSGSLHWWESTSAGEQVFVLNKRTGELYAVQEGELRKVSENLTAPWEGPDASEQPARRNRIATDTWLFGDVVKVDVQTKYRGQRLEVRGTIEPYIEGLSTLRFGRVLTLHFRDLQSFGVVDVELQPGDLTQVVDSDGKGMSFAFSKTAAVAPTDWREAVLLEVSWVDQTSRAVENWKRSNPKDAAARQELAAAAHAAETARMLEMLDAAEKLMQETSKTPGDATPSKETADPAER